VDLAISAAGRRIIDAVIDAPVAWRSPGELANRLGWTLEQTLDEIADLDVRGWLEAWELVDGPVVTFSLAAAAHCGVRLVEVGHDETSRWARTGDPDPPGVPASGVFRGERMAALDLVADRRPDAATAAILAEAAEAQILGPDDARHHLAWIDKLPKPTLLIGGGLSPWPGPNQAGGDHCPACRSDRLPARAYCLWCDRWEFDGAIGEPSVVRSKPRRSPSKVVSHKNDTQRQESERRQRRAKRKERRSAQAHRLRAVPRRDEPFWAVPITG